MAYTRVKYGTPNGPYNYSVFIADSEGDINSLPTNSTYGMLNGRKVGFCSVGSKAIVTGTKKEYMMNNAGEWVYMGQYSGSGNTSGGSLSVDDDGNGNVTVS